MTDPRLRYDPHTQFDTDRKDHDMITNALVEGRSLRKTYQLGKRAAVPALRGVDISIAQGEMVAIMGPSGSGKSTLMHILGLLHAPETNSGPRPELWFEGRDMTRLGEAERRAQSRASGEQLDQGGRIRPVGIVEGPVGRDDLPGERSHEDLSSHAGVGVGFGGHRSEVADRWVGVEGMVESGGVTRGGGLVGPGVGLGDGEIPAAYRKPVKEMAVQFVRNAVIHGIEAPHTREASGKAGVGRLSIAFGTDPNGGYEMVIEDDGAGLDATAIRAKAVACGLISQEEADSMDNSRVFSLIFRAGFSTVDEAGKDAGRGVGLDLVRHRVRELGGRLRLSSAKGRRTEFRVSLPEPSSQATTASRLSAQRTWA